MFSIVGLCKNFLNFLLYLNKALKVKIFILNIIEKTFNVWFRMLPKIGSLTSVRKIPIPTSTNS